MGCDPHLTYTRDTDIFKEGTTAVQSVTKIIKKKTKTTTKLLCLSSTVKENLWRGSDLKCKQNFRESSRTLLETNVFILWNPLQEDVNEDAFLKSWTQAMVFHQHPGLIGRNQTCNYLGKYIMELLWGTEVKYNLYWLQLSLNPRDTVLIFGLVLYCYLNLCPASKVITSLLANTVIHSIPWTIPTVPRLPGTKSSGFIWTQRVLLAHIMLASFRSSGWLCQECLPVISTTITLLVKSIIKGYTWNQGLEWEDSTSGHLYVKLSAQVVESENLTTKSRTATNVFLKMSNYLHALLTMLLPGYGLLQLHTYGHHNGLMFWFLTLEWCELPDKANKPTKNKPKTN